VKHFPNRGEESTIVSKQPDDELLVAWNRRALITQFTDAAVRGVLVLGGATAAGILQFYAPSADGHFSNAQIAGMLASLAAAIGGLWMIGTEFGSKGELTLATREREQARLLKDSIADLRTANVRINASHAVSRNVADSLNALTEGFSDDETLVASLLETAARDLAVAAGLIDPAVWSIAIYKAEEQAGGTVLRVVASARALKHNLQRARIWPINEGVPGVAYTQKHPISVPDIHDDATAGVFRPSESRERDYDRKRYRSALAYQLRVQEGDPWGVLVATSDSPGHFHSDPDGHVDTEMPLREFAKLVVVALRLRIRLGERDADLLSLDPGLASTDTPH
jgi:hypothetical protein